METVIPKRRLSEEPSVCKGFLGYMCFSGLYSRSALSPDLRQIKMAAGDTTACFTPKSILRSNSIRHKKTASGGLYFSFSQFLTVRLQTPNFSVQSSIVKPAFFRSSEKLPHKKRFYRQRLQKLKLGIGARSYNMGT
jgi:hypothetical protein